MIPKILLVITLAVSSNLVEGGEFAKLQVITRGRERGGGGSPYSALIYALQYISTVVWVKPREDCRVLDPSIPSSVTGFNVIGG